MSKRRAVLIGVGKYDEPDYVQLPATLNDISRVSSALEKLGYQTASYGGDGGLLTGRRLESVISREVKSPDVDVLIVYFSGHGLNYEGIDYLVPSDAMGPSSVVDDTDKERFRRSLVALDFRGDLLRSQAQTVIFIVDACRDGISSGSKSAATVESLSAHWGEGLLEEIPSRRHAVMLACAPGDLARVSNDGQESLFSRALSETLERSPVPRTLGKLRAAVDGRLAEHFRRERNEPPRARVHLRGEVAGQGYEWDLFDAVAEMDREANPFRKALEESQLWQRHFITGVAPEPVVEALRQLANLAWLQFERARHDVPEDPWTDSTFPTRVLEQAYRWSGGVTGATAGGLSTDEVALLLAAPFARELVLASAKSRLAAESPCQIDSSLGAASKTQVPLARSQLAHPQLLHLATRALERGQREGSEAIAAWLMHVHIRRDPETWWPAGSAVTWRPDWFKGLPDNPVVRDILRPQRLLELARAVLGQPDFISRDDRPHALQDAVESGAGSIRERLLAYILCLAGWSALDPRQIPQIAVEHVCVAAPLLPRDVVAAIGSSRWSTTSNTRSLHVACVHPALDIALRTCVDWADEALRAVLRCVPEPQLPGLRWPARVVADGVVPMRTEAGPAYLPEGLRFELAQDEIRELLMGERLYGNPSLAIRELYQNALDACRYREMRTRYLRTGGAQLSEYAGHIWFRAGIDAGRAYVECEDNGIGMGLTELRSCFAKAGRRFPDQPEFIEEQAEWLAADPKLRLHPNSTFGIGVLSYFMLAEDIEIYSCRLDRQGRPGDGMLVQVPGSGSLFRITGMGRGAAAGTRVRLFLRAGVKVSCAATLNELLWITDYQVSVEEGSIGRQWTPRTLQRPVPRHEYEQITKSLHPTGDPRVWWYGGSQALADGLAVEADSEVSARGLGGLLINFVEADRAQLNVARTKLLRFPVEWLHRILSERWRTALDWPALSLEWLWGLNAPLLVKERLARELMARDAELPVREGNVAVTVRIRRCGVFPPDARLLAHFRSDYRHIHDDHSLVYAFPAILVRRRAEFWNELGLLSVSPSELAALPTSSVALDQLLPSDAAILSDRLDCSWPWLGRGQADTTALCHILAAAQKVGRSPQEIAARLREFGLETPPLPGTLPELTEHDLVLLSAECDGTAPWIPDHASIDHIRLAAFKTKTNPSEVALRLQTLGVQCPAVPESWERPEKGDLVLLSQQLDGQRPWLSDSAEASHILAAAVLTGRPWETLVDRLRSLGLTCQPIRDGTVQPVRDDLPLLSYPLNGRPPWRLASKWGPVQILVASANTRTPPYRIRERVMQLGFVVSESRHCSVVPNQMDVTLLSRDLDAMPPWVEEPISISHVLRASIAAFGAPQQVAHRLEGLGLNCATVTNYAQPTTDDLLILSSGLDARFPWLKNNVDWVHVLRASVQTKRPPKDISAQLKGWGFSLMQIREDVAEPTELDLPLLSEKLNGESPWVGDVVSLPHVLKAAIASRRHPQEVSERISALGLGCPRLASDVRQPTEEDSVLLSALRGLESGVDSWTLILLASLESGLLPIDICSRLGALGFSCALRANLARPTNEDRVLLSRDLDGQAPWLEESWVTEKVPLGHLIKASKVVHESPYKVAERLRELGFECIDVPPAESVADLDLRLLSQNSDGNWPWLARHAPVGQVLAASARLSLSPREIAARLQNLGVACPIVAGHQAISEEDLLLLSTDLDGRGPWLENAGSWPQLLAAWGSTGREPQSIASCWDAFGIRPPAIREATLRPSPVDLLPLSRAYDGRAPWCEGPPPPVHILIQSIVTGRSTAEVAASLSAMGIEAPCIPKPGARFDAIDRFILSEDLDGGPPFLTNPPAPEAIARITQRIGLEPEELLRRVRRLCAEGLLRDPQKACVLAESASESPNDLITKGRAPARSLRG